MDDLLSNDSLPLKLLMGFLNRSDSGSLLNKEEWHQLETDFGERLYANILFVLTRQEFEPDQAKTYWHEILAHKRTLDQAVSRDVGLRVAVCDYFINVKQKLKDLVFVEIESLLEKEQNAFLDELTGLHNRRYFNQVLSKEVEFGKRYEQSFSILVLDIDHFKNFNDANGHLAGDRSLREFAGILKKKARTIDHIIRYGGEEFVIILPRSNKTEAVTAAGRYRAAVEEFRFAGEQKLPGGKLTVSIGVSTFPVDAVDGLNLLRRADDALYQSKAKGRNLVIAATPDKRYEPRYPFQTELLFRLREDEQETVRKGLSEDISLGGLLCQVKHPMEIGKALDVDLSLPNAAEPLSLKARAVRLLKDDARDDTYLLGLSFVLKNEAKQMALKDIIAAFPKR